MVWLLRHITFKQTCVTLTSCSQHNPGQWAGADTQAHGSAELSEEIYISSGEEIILSDSANQTRSADIGAWQTFWKREGAEHRHSDVFSLVTSRVISVPWFNIWQVSVCMLDLLYLPINFCLTEVSPKWTVSSDTWYANFIEMVYLVKFVLAHMICLCGASGIAYNKITIFLHFHWNRPEVNMCF